MKVAVIGSRNLQVHNLSDYLPPETTELISGGARGIDTCARAYALSHGIQLTEFLPAYESYGRSAPLLRNCEIVAAADFVLAFWDGSSKGTAYTIKKCKELGVPYKVFRASRPASSSLSPDEGHLTASQGSCAPSSWPSRGSGQSHA